MVNINGIEVRTELSEMTLLELDDISKALNNDKLDYVDKYLKVLSILKLDDETIDGLSFDDLVHIIKNFATKKEETNKNLIKEIEIDGYTYQAYDDDKFIIKVKDVSMIEKNTKQTGYFSILDSIAIIFKRTDLSKDESYIPAHIKYKKELFGKINADIVYPYLVYITEKLASKIKTLYDIDESI